MYKGPQFQNNESWAGEFKRGRTRLENDPREGRPKTASIPEIINITILLVKIQV